MFCDANQLFHPSKSNNIITKPKRLMVKSTQGASQRQSSTYKKQKCQKVNKTLRRLKNFDSAQPRIVLLCDTTEAFE